jgi:RNA polymerase sigma-70 factor (ECF subfamily)
MDGANEAELVRRCLQGDAQAFEPLVQKYQKVLFNVALRMVGSVEEARDITQSTFLKAYEKLRTFDGRHKFFSWIYRILINESLNVLKQRKSHQPLDPGLESTGNPQAEAQARELQDHVQAALMKLSPEHREVLVLRHFAELSYGDMSATLRIPETTVKSRLYEARQRLGELLLAEHL